MGRGLKVGLLITIAGSGATVLGLIVMFLYSLSEVLANPGTSLVDGYWIGRLPWAAIGVDLVVIGSTIAVLFGTAATWVAGGAARRLISLAPLAVAAAWWAFAWIASSIEGAPCSSCGQPAFDPFAVAYSVPAEAVLLLVLPAAISALIALSGERRRGPAT